MKKQEITEVDVKKIIEKARKNTKNENKDYPQTVQQAKSELDLAKSEFFKSLSHKQMELFLIYLAKKTVYDEFMNEEKHPN